MRRFAVSAVLVIAAACSGGEPTPAPATTQPASSGPGGVLEQAEDVADQLNQRESDLEQQVEEMLGSLRDPFSPL